MTFKEFASEAKRTLPNLSTSYVVVDGVERPVHTINLIHTRLGIVSELSEVISALRSQPFDKVNLAEELCDILWYAANDIMLMSKRNEAIIDLHNFVFGEGLQATDGGVIEEGAFRSYWFNPLYYNASELTDTIKKEFAYGKVMNNIEYTVQMRYLLGAINNMAKEKEINLGEAMERLINKLRVRYPEKFTEESAINRNLEKERDALEGKASPSDDLLEIRV